MICNLDQKILNILLEKSRLSYRQIAKKLKTSVATIISHIKRLEDEKIIQRYTTDFDYYKLGYDLKVIVQLRISKGQLFEVEKKIAKHPAVFAVYDVTGDFDAIVLARFKSRQSLDKFLKTVQKYEFVERTHTGFILNTMKEEQDKIS
ncbi:Lrp/AsnC family transcriptional regulator [Candidatus Woesearchaeota archaeon]|nr:Lrp/AsnC family transcriptional regulator [Candidatus Woesearchaeota archaeon]